MFEPKISQVIYEFKLKNLYNFFNMRRIAQNCCDVIFDSSKFSGVRIRIKNTNASIVFFCCGFGRILGCLTEEIVDDALHQLRKKLKFCGYRTRLMYKKLISITAHTDIQQPIRKMDEYINYFKFIKREKFSGYFIYINDLTAIVFHNGKINYMGAKSIDQIINTNKEIINFFINKNCISK